MITTKSCPIAQFAKTDPKSPAIITPSQIITYQQLNEAIQNATQTLTTLPRFHPIQWTTSNSVDDIITIWACFRANRIAFPISPKLPQTQVNSIHTTSRSLIISPKDLAKISPTQDHTPQLHLNQTATYLLTSGTTGMPKIAIHTLGNYFINASGTLHNIPLIPSDRWSLTLPLYHVGGIGILMRCFLSRAAVIIPAPSTSLTATINDSKTTHISVVPTQLKKILEEAAPSLPTLHAIIVGGAQCPTNLITQALNRNLPIYTTYGLTEMTSQVTTAPPQASAKDLQTSGMLLCNRDLKLSHTNEIWVKGPCLFQGYLIPQNPPYEKTSHLSLTEDRWFQTKDIGTLDSKGRLRIIGRADRMIISGGENIYPEEIETALLSIPEVQTAIVRPQNNAHWGQRPIAYVHTSTPLSNTLKTKIIHALNDTLPKYKIPDQILPASLSDKTWKQ